MPQLKNLRREAFCQMLIEGARFGWSQGTCYMKAGYRTTGHGAEVNAGHPLYGEVLRAECPELARVGILRRLLGATFVNDGARGVQLRRIGSWALDAGVSLSPRVQLAAAREALAVGDAHHAEQQGIGRILEERQRRGG